MEAIRVLMVFSPTYRLRFDKKEAQGIGVGARHEAHILYHRCVDAGWEVDFCRVIYFEDHHINSVRQEFKHFSNWHAVRDFDQILEWILNAFVNNDPLPLPTRNLIPKSIGNSFKGRLRFLDTLHRRLLGADGPDGVSFEKRMAVILGLGGCGKTRAAIEYGHLHQPNYQALLFARADTPAVFGRNLAKLAGRRYLGLSETDATEQQALDATIDWLRENSKWLLIIDNVDDDDAATGVYSILIDELGNDYLGHIIITARRNSYPLEEVDTYELPNFLEDNEGPQYLLQLTSGKREALDPKIELKLANEITTRLGGLPLALKQAAAFIATTYISLKEYIDLLNTTPVEVLESYGNLPIRDYHHSVYTTWNITVSRLSSTGKLLLRALAHFSSEPIPRFIFSFPRSSGHPANWLIPASELINYALTYREQGHGTIQAHCVLQQVILLQLTHEDRCQSVKDAANILSVAIANTDPQDIRSWESLASLRPHIESVISKAELLDLHTWVTRLRSKLGLYLASIGLHDEGIKHYQSLLSTSQTKTTNPYPPDIAIRHNNLAVLLEEAERFSEAEYHYRSALFIDCTYYLANHQFGCQHPSIARDYTNLGGLLENIDIEAARECYNHAIQILRNFGTKDQLSSALNNLSLFCIANTETEEGETLLRESLALETSTNYGPQRAIHHNNFGNLLYHQGKFSDAKQHFESAIREMGSDPEPEYDSPDPEHLFVGFFLVNLSKALSKLQQPESATAASLRASRIISALATEHPYLSILGGEIVLHPAMDSA